MKKIVVVMMMISLSGCMVKREVYIIPIVEKTEIKTTRGADKRESINQFRDAFKEADKQFSNNKNCNLLKMKSKRAAEALKLNQKGD
jgi:hypothetical protein